MKHILILISLLSMKANAAPLKCSYDFMGSPMGSVSLDITDNKPSATASVSLFFSPSREVTVSNQTPRPTEYLYFILSKDDPSNEMEMILYADQGGLISSKLINPSSPMGKELLGNCQYY